MIDQPIGVYLNWSSYDELSYTVELGQFTVTDLAHPIRIRCSSWEPSPVQLQGSVYQVTY